MRIITVRMGQSVEDVALQYYGTTDGSILILMDNNLSPDFEPLVGQKLSIRDEVPQINDTNKDVERYLQDKSIAPNSSLTAATAPVELYIEVDYVDDDYIE